MSRFDVAIDWQRELMARINKAIRLECAWPNVRSARVETLVLDDRRGMQAAVGMRRGGDLENQCRQCQGDQNADAASRRQSPLGSHECAANTILVDCFAGVSVVIMV